MKALIKNHFTKLLMACLSLSTFLSVLINIRKCPYQNLCYFGEGFFLYENLVSSPIYFIGFKILFLIFACLMLFVLDFDLKDKYEWKIRAFSLTFFAGILGIYLNNSDFEIISLFFMFLALASFKRVESKNNAKEASFFLAISLSNLLLMDLKNIVFVATILIVLFLTDDILEIINLKKLMKSASYFLLGLIPLVLLIFCNNFLELKAYFGNFEIYLSDYIFKTLAITSLKDIKGHLLLSLFLPFFFFACGLLVLILDEVLNFINKKEEKLSTYSDLSYYIALWFVVFYAITFSYLLKQQVPLSFFYFVLLPLPYVLSKGLNEIFDKFKEAKETKIISIILTVLLSLIMLVSVASYKKSLKNYKKVETALNLYEWVNEIKGTYVSNGYDTIINYMLGYKKVAPFVFKNGNLGLYEMVKDYDYYISYNGVMDNNCVILTEPNLDLMLNPTVFSKYWACKGYEFTLDMKQFIFKVENLK